MQLSAVFHIVMIHWVLNLYGCMDGAMILSLPGRNIECWLSDRGEDNLLLAGDGVDLPLRDKGPVIVSCMNILLLVHFVALSVIDSRVASCASSLNLQAVYVIF